MKQILNLETALKQFTLAYEGANYIPLVTDPVNCLFSLTRCTNIEPVCGKMYGQIISSVRRDNLTTHFATNRLNIRRYCEQK